MSPARPHGSAPSVYLHIGTTKSGTSYVQNALWRHRVRLADDGILFPGADRWAEQVEAVRDVLRDGRPTRRSIKAGAWNSMRDQMLAWPGPTAILSMELLSLAGPERVAHIVSSLHPADVHAVITARDLARVIPSAWQESVQNHQTWSWEEYVDAITSAERRSTTTITTADRFWQQQDVPLIARTWADALGTDHVHLVVVPRAGSPRDDLWRRFAPVVGVDPDDYTAPDHIRGNPALGAASAEFLRRLNVRLGKRFDIASYEKTVKDYLAKETFGQVEEGERLRLPPEHQEWAADRATKITQQVRELGIDVHGDLDDLVPRPDRAGKQSVMIDEHDVAEAGLQAVEALVRALEEVAPGEGHRGARRAGTGADPERRARRKARRAGLGHP